ncbi:hypothetical protein L3X38_028252 [Prunus dulcis]|uniref:Uncharacterized protein n=1 Tax=Prunus dulcis TaxID=3755 RepID=A0AAD4Z137_PRUDU|nr:hypothetical protein L3X38_028252 [Prunus dulcis]
MTLLLIRKNLSSVLSILLILIIITLFFATVHATHFVVRNQCHFTVWAASLPGGGKQLLPGQTWSFDMNTGTFPTNMPKYHMSPCEYRGGLFFQRGLTIDIDP